ncbi:MAG: mechanosensitive ion channel family protein [Bifidobacteriaceae bacterium]|jgi:small conductance mechanosensitive channel|nr:mechanosensitive ion channel family protein [Bifidobacteriaceae bacterium]
MPALIPFRVRGVLEASASPTNSPEWAADWPEWARFLMGTPLRIAIILVCAFVVAAVAHAVVRRATNRMARGAARGIVLGSAAVVGFGPAARDPERAAARRAARLKTLGSVLNSVVSAVVWILAACLILESLGVNVGLIITSLGVAGVAIGLGAQSLVKDMVAGIFLLVEDQYGIGDEVDAGPATGVVESMSLRVTTLRDADNVVWYIPNGSIARVGNKSQDVSASASAGADSIAEPGS